jgi:protease I
MFWRNLVLFGLISLCLFIGCKKEEEDLGTMPRIDGKKIVMIIVHKDFRDEEFEEPQEIFIKQGAEVTIASSSMETATGMLGARIKPDILVDDVKVEDYDAIVFVGGSGASEYWNNPTAHKIAKEAVESNKILCAICIAPVTLANAGVLDGKRATVYSSEEDKLEAKGANCTGKNVEVDGNIITGSGPDAAKKFGKAIVEALAS